MNCQNHPDLPAVAFCRSCGKALCQTCQCLAQGTVYCSEHAPVDAPPPIPNQPEASPWTAPASANVNAAPPNPGVSPGLAFILGLIPGVGAIYNGQYAKGLIHVVILGLLISIESSGASGGMEALFGMMIALWFPYMAFEAYHTAKKRQYGQPVDEFSSLLPSSGASASSFPVAPLALIALGVLFLLNNLDILRFHQIARYWPVILIACGVYLLYARIAGTRANSVTGEARHEQQ